MRVAHSPLLILSPRSPQAAPRRVLQTKQRSWHCPPFGSSWQLSIRDMKPKRGGGWTGGGKWCGGEPDSPMRSPLLKRKRGRKGRFPNKPEVQIWETHMTAKPRPWTRERVGGGGCFLGIWGVGWESSGKFAMQTLAWPCDELQIRREDAAGLEKRLLKMLPSLLGKKGQRVSRPLKISACDEGRLEGLSLSVGRSPPPFPCRRPSVSILLWVPLSEYHVASKRCWARRDRDGEGFQSNNMILVPMGYPKFPCSSRGGGSRRRFSPPS